MKEITEKEVEKIINDNKEEIDQIVNQGGKVINTTIYEKDKITHIRKIEPAEGNSTGTKVIQTKESITIQKL